MEEKEFKKEVLEITLRCVDKKPEDWTTFNDKMHTKIVDDNYIPTKVSLLPNELPILECDLSDSYLLVTTNRVISIYEKKNHDIYPNNFDSFFYGLEKYNYQKINGQYPKTNTIGFNKTDKTTFLAYIDSDYPSFFTKILIYNIMLYKKEGRWYLNPSKKNYE